MSKVIKMKNKSQNKKYWEFKNKAGNEADLYLYGEIASWGYGYEAHSAKSFKRDLDDLGEISTLNVYVNSPGGSVFEGVSIYNMLKRHKAHINIHIDGLAASIASVIAMAGDSVIMPSNAMMMIHNASTFVWGNSQELSKAIKMLDKVNVSMSQSYVDKADGITSEEDFKTMMDDETWLTAQECLDYGLCDEVGDDIELSACISSELFNSYKNVPKYLTAETKNSLDKLQQKEMVDEEIETLIARVNLKLEKEGALI